MSTNRTIQTNQHLSQTDVVVVFVVVPDGKLQIMWRHLVAVDQIVHLLVPLRLCSVRHVLCPTFIGHPGKMEFLKKVPEKNSLGNSKNCVFHTQKYLKNAKINWSKQANSLATRQQVDFDERIRQDQCSVILSTRQTSRADNGYGQDAVELVVVQGKVQIALTASANVMQCCRRHSAATLTHHTRAVVRRNGRSLHGQRCKIKLDNFKVK